MINYTELWNNFCSHFIELHTKNVSEEIYEQSIMSFLQDLGWSKFRNEIQSQIPIQVGHEIKKVDISLSKEEKYVLAIEVKRPSLIIRETNAPQLISYMRLLEPKVRIGLLWGNEIWVYYDDPSNDNQPSFICSIQFTENNETGIKLLSLLDKENFSIEKFDSFCKSQIEKKQQQEILKKEIELLTSPNGDEVLKKALRDYYRDRNLDSSFIEEILKEIKFSIKKNNDFVIERETTEIPNFNNQTNQHYYKNDSPRGRRVKVFFNINDNPINYDMSEFAAKIVELYVRANPNITFQSLQRVFPDSKMGCPSPFIETHEIISGRMNQRRNKFACKLSDGTDIYTSNQWSWGSSATMKTFYSYVKNNIAPKLGISVKFIER